MITTLTGKMKARGSLAFVDQDTAGVISISLRRVTLVVY